MEATARVVFVVQTYHPAVDGTALLIRRLAEQLASDGTATNVITSRCSGPGGFRSARKDRLVAPKFEIVNGVLVHRLRTWWIISLLAGPVQALLSRGRLPGAERVGDLYMGPLLVGLRRTLRRLDPSAVYCSAFPYRHMHVLAHWGRRHGVPVLLHGAIHPDEAWAFDRDSIRRSVALGAMYCANTRYEARHVEGWGLEADRVRVIGVGVDIPGPLSAPRGPKAEQVLYFGHLTRHKGVDTVVDALPELWERFPNLEVVIAGKSTDDSRTLQAEAEAIAVGRKLRWLTNVTEEQKLELMRSARAVLYPSRAESFGIVFLEAWAAGVPVVGCDAGAIPDVVEHGRTGLLIPPGDSKALAEAVALLLSDPDTASAMGAAGRNNVERDFEWSRVAARVRDAIHAASALTDTDSCS